jgi:hypothetical protein
MLVFGRIHSHIQIASSLSLIFKTSDYFPGRNAENMFFNAVVFYKAYHDFKKATGKYYFDDYATEQFMGKLTNKIFGMIKDMIRTITLLKLSFSIFKIMS